MQYADDLDPFCYDSVKDDMPGNRKAPQAFFQFVTRTAHVRVAGQCLKFLVNDVNKSICPRFVIIRDIIPYLG